MPLKPLTQAYGQGYCCFTKPTPKLPSLAFTMLFHRTSTLWKYNTSYSSLSQSFVIENILTNIICIVK